VECDRENRLLWIKVPNVLEAVWQDAFEDHLRATPIQSGSPRYGQIKVADISAKRVEPRILRPLQFYDCKGLFLYKI
jgi:hypothetical protein